MRNEKAENLLPKYMQMSKKDFGGCVNIASDPGSYRAARPLPPPLISPFSSPISHNRLGTEALGAKKKTYRPLPCRLPVHTFVRIYIHTFTLEKIQAFSVTNVKGSVCRAHRGVTRSWWVLRREPRPNLHPNKIIMSLGDLINAFVTIRHVVMKWKFSVVCLSARGLIRYGSSIGDYRQTFFGLN